MFLSLLFGIILITPGRALTSGSKNNKDTNDRQNSDYGYIRQKRSSLLYKIGVAAVNAILKGTKELKPKSPFHKRYEKKGDIRTAIRDFYSLEPRDVRIYIRGKGAGKGIMKLTGQVGDQELILTKLSRAEKATTLELKSRQTEFGTAHVNTVYGDPFDRIIYKKVIND